MGAWIHGVAGGRPVVDTRPVAVDVREPSAQQVVEGLGECAVMLGAVDDDPLAAPEDPHGIRG